jgi:hypothetical protein
LHAYPQFRFTTACRYVQSFTPQTAAFPNYVYPPNLTSPTDPYLANVALLCHFDGTAGSTTITDSGPNGYTITRSVNSGTTAVSLVTSTSEGGGTRFGTSSCQLNAGYSPSTYGSFSLPTSQTPLNMSTGDFTIEFWIARNGQPNPTGQNGYVFSCGTASLEGFTTNASSGQQFEVTYNGTALVTGLTCVMDDAWHAIAITRQTGTIYLLIDGVVQGSAALANAVDFGGSSYGRRSSSDTTMMSCNLMDELRITKGVSRYNSNYTLQRGPF